MDNAQSYAIFGGNNYSQIPATMLNADAQSEQDFGTILTNGIRGVAINAINGMVNGAYGSGQLQNAGAVTVSAGGNTGNLIILAAIAYFIFKS